MNRRGLLAAGVAAAGLLATRRSGAAGAALRPPGALPPGRFEEACVGCLRCGEVCPTRTIQFAGKVTPGGGLPFLDLRAHPCILCMACTRVCPTDALTPLDPDPQRVAATVRIGRPVLDRRACLPWSGEGVCRLCAYACPYAGKAVELVGPQQAPLFHPEACVGCGLCEEACPEQARAIQIVPWNLAEAPGP